MADHINDYAGIELGPIKAAERGEQPFAQGYEELSLEQVQVLRCV